MMRSIQFIVPTGIALIAALGIGIIWFFLPKEDKCLKIAAGLQGGDSHTFGKKMEDLVKKSSDSKICINVLATEGTRQSLEKLNNNEAQLAMAQADILVMNNLPKLQTDKRENLDVNFLASLDKAQIVSFLFPDMYQLIVRADSGIKSVSDLENKRIAMPPENGGQIISFTFLMQHYRLIAKDRQLVEIKEVGKEDEDLKTALCENSVDAVFQVRSNYTPAQLTKFRDVIIEKAAQILVEKRVAELAFERKLISDGSLKSFNKALQKAVNAIEKMPEKVSTEIFNNIPQEATKVLDEQHTKFLQNQWLPFIDNRQNFFGLMSLDQLQNSENENLKTNLDKTLQNVLTSTNVRQALQGSSQYSQFLKSESLEIQRDLDAIFKRAVQALVEERISQESFQSFRVVWQIAVDDIDKLIIP